MRVYGAVEFHIKGNAGIIGLQPDAMAAQAFQYGNGKRADGGGQRVGPKAARPAEVPLPAGNRDAGKSVHDIAVGMVTKAYVKDDVAAGHGVAGVPEALHPRRSLLSIWSKVVGSWWPMRSSCGVSMALPA